jgi:hypothetical protein
MPAGGRWRTDRASTLAKKALFQAVIKYHDIGMRNAVRESRERAMRDAEV